MINALKIVSLFGRISIVITGLLLFSAAAIFSQQTDIRFDHISIEEGLSQSSVFCIAQDSAGYMWFGTEDGLNRYDGYDFRIYRHEPRDSGSISALGIRNIFVDGSGNLWVVMLDGKLDLYDPVTENFLHIFLPGIENKINTESIISVEEAGHGLLFIGTANGSLYRYDYSGTITKDENFPPDSLASVNMHLYCMDFAEPNQLYIGTWNGLYIYNTDSGEITYVTDDDSPISLGGNMIFDVAATEEGVWIASVNGGLTYLSIEDSVCTTYKHNDADDRSISSDRIMSLFLDSREQLWVGTLDMGICTLQPDGTFDRIQHNPAYPWSLSSGGIFSIAEDRGGSIWIGSASEGINRYNPRSRHFRFITHQTGRDDGISPHSILSICEDSRGTLWIGSDGGGLSRRKKDEPGFEYFLRNTDNYGGNSVTAIFEDSFGNVWAGTDPGVNTTAGGIFKFDYKKNKLLPVKEITIAAAGITHFYEDSDGLLWIGTAADGVKCYNLKTGAISSYKYDRNDETSIGGNSVFDIIEGPDGTIWFATLSNGLSRYYKDEGKFKRYIWQPDDTTSISSKSVWCINTDERGRLWFGTWGGGLCRYDAGADVFIRYGVNDGLPSSIVYGILPAGDSTLWLSTSRGLSKFNSKTGEFTNFDKSDGLEFPEFNQGAFYKGSDGTFYFGGAKGVTYFHPDSIQKNPFIPPIVITSFSVFGKPVPINKALMEQEEIVLSYRQNFFAFEFAALDYAASEYNQYAYCLQGIDEDWVDAGNRRYASYTDIAPGEYVFEVRGSNSDGIWNETPVSVPLVITPPFWQTTWFRLLALLFAAAVLYGIHRYRLHKLLEIERTRNRIARDLHDDVSATITGIVYFSEAAAKETENSESGSMNKLLGLIRESATEVQEKMSDIIWSINPQNDTWDIILPKFRRFAADMLESKNIAYSISIPELLPEKPLPMERRRDLWLIFKEIVTNAVKHSDCSEVFISFTIENKILRIRITDDGTGFNPESVKEGNGVKNIYKRGEALEAEIILSTAEGKGASWDIRIPMKTK